MRVTPFPIWLVSFTVTILAAVFLPALRVVLFCIATVHVPVFALGIKNMRFRFFGKAYCSVSRESNRIALTFDDGPDPELTPDILAVLKKNDIKATFFVVGAQAEKHPDIVKKCYDAGHTIANHDLSHAVFSNFRITAPLMRDISKAQQIINRIIGKQTLIYRPPVGLMNPHTLKALRKLGMACVGWSRGTGDGGNRWLKRIRHIKTLAGPGQVVMMHDCLLKPQYKKDILDQIDSLCISLKEQGLEAVTVDELFGIPAYK